VASLLAGPIWTATGEKDGFLDLLHHEGFYAVLFPHWLLIGFYTFFWGLAMVGGLMGVARFWQAMKTADEASGSYKPTQSIVASTIAAVVPIFTHDKFEKCGSQAPRRWAHLGAFYGFAVLFIVSVWAVVALYMINPFISDHDSHLAYPFPLLDFSIQGFFGGVLWKLLANAGAIALIAGCVIAIRERTSGKEDAGASTSFDWVFVYLLLAVGITGFVTQVFRWIVAPDFHADAFEMTGLAYLAYGVYFLHLVVVFDLLVYLPYSKFAHVLYRTAALVYAEHSGRNKVKQETEQ